MQMKARVSYDIAYLLVITKGDFPRVTSITLIWTREEVSQDSSPSHTDAYGFGTPFIANKQCSSFQLYLL